MGCFRTHPVLTSSGNAGRSRPCGLCSSLKTGWVAGASGVEIVGCGACFSRRFGALTGVAAVLPVIHATQEMGRCIQRKRLLFGREETNEKIQIHFV